MSKPIPSSETFAVIVGVENYQGGKDWNLNGPASDAARFADWLHKKLVPADQIAVFVSPLDPTAEKLRWPSGCVPQPATHANLNTLLHETLDKRPERQLIMYWGGHGVCQGGDTRRLFYADARTRNKRNLNLDHLLLFLRSNRWPEEKWSRQIILVDACANLAEHEGWTEALPDEGFAVGAKTVVSREQYTLFAASAGEYALNLDAEQTGIFSRELLAELERRPADEWPPDMDAVTRKLNVRFAELREKGLAYQTPTFLWNRDWGGGETSSGDPDLRRGVPQTGAVIATRNADSAARIAAAWRRTVSSPRRKTFAAWPGVCRSR